MIGSQIPPIGPLCVLLFKNLKIKNFYRSTQRGEEMRGFAPYFPLSSCKGMISEANEPLENPPIDPLRVLLFKRSEEKNLNRSAQRGEEMRGFAHYFPLSSCKGMISEGNEPLENPSN
jgi:hypothetical protein